MGATLTSTLAVADAQEGPAPPADAADAPAVLVEGLTKVYPGAVTAVDALDLTVRAGEIFGLLGPNGAGKTTTVGMLTTRIVPSFGRALVGGVDVAADPARARQRFGVVSQGNTLDSSLNVRENLILHGRYHGMRARTARRAADEWLGAFRLSPKAKARVDQLSGGMARRLMLARAMLHGPDVLFLDEPTAGLDPQSRAAFWDIVRGLRALGRTIFLTTHYMEEADQFCDRVAVMDHGAVLALGTPHDLKRSHGTGVSITVRADGDQTGLVRALGRVGGATSVALDGGVRVRLDDGDGALVKVITAAEGGGFRLTDVSMAEDSLETVFINLTGRDLRE